MMLLPAIGLLWLAYRIIRNGFITPQSEKLNGFGVLGRVVLACLALSLVGGLLG